MWKCDSFRGLIKIPVPKDIRLRHRDERIMWDSGIFGCVLVLDKYDRELMHLFSVCVHVSIWNKTCVLAKQFFHEKKKTKLCTIQWAMAIVYKYKIAFEFSFVRHFSGDNCNDDLWCTKYASNRFRKHNLFCLTSWP